MRLISSHAMTGSKHLGRHIAALFSLFAILLIVFGPLTALAQSGFQSGPRSSQGPTSSPGVGHGQKSYKKIHKPAFTLYALPKAAPIYKKPVQIRKRQVTEINHRHASHSQSGNHARLKRSSSGGIDYDIQTIAPSACYEAGKVFISTQDQQANHYGLAMIYAHVRFSPGLCAQSLTPIRFQGTLRTESCRSFDQALIVVVDERSKNITTIGPVACE